MRLLHSVPVRRSAFCPFRAFSVTWVCEHHECHEYWFQENHKQVSLVSLDKRIDTGKLTVTHAPTSRATLPKGFTWAEKSHHFKPAHFVLTFHSESSGSFNVYWVALFPVIIPNALSNICPLNFGELLPAILELPLSS